MAAPASSGTCSAPSSRRRRPASSARAPSRGAGRPPTALLALLAIQLTLGLATADFRTEPLPRANPAMIAVATAHLVIGALLLGTAVLLAFRAFRLKTATPV